MSDLPEIRVSDADRERAVLDLREHAVAGRLTLEEFGERVEQAYAARTRGELDVVLRELPSPPSAPARSRRGFGLALMGGLDWRGRLRLAERSTIVTVMGGANIDLRSAIIEAPEVTIRTWTIMGGVKTDETALPLSPSRAGPDPGVLADGRRERQDRPVGAAPILELGAP